MALLQEYLNSVRFYLPRSAEQQDILRELSEHLQVKLDERAEELGRNLTADEETAVLWGYGNPVAVAARYAPQSRGLSFGRELIGPAIFPIYRWVLITQFALTIIVVTIINAVGHSTGSPIARYLAPMLAQFVLTTTIFIAIDLFQKRSTEAKAFSAPMHLIPVPRWQSISGFITLAVVAVWWAAIPFAPFLLLGSAAGRVTFTDNWHAFYWPVLLPLIAGAAQRLATFVEPRWSGLQSATRLITNGWLVVMVLLFAASAPYVAPASADADALARGINNGMWWNALATFGLYWLVNTGFMGYLCAKHAAHYLRRRREQVAMQSTVQS